MKRVVHCEINSGELFVSLRAKRPPAPEAHQPQVEEADPPLAESEAKQSFPTRIASYQLSF